MKVPLIDLVAQHREIRDEVMAAVTQVFDKQHFIMGEDVELFEHDAANYCHAKSAMGCASGSDALLLALQALNVGPGDEVITTSFSFFATASAITRLGARPVFVDISPDDFNLNPELLEEKITPRTKVIMPVHLYGQCANMDEIARIANKYSIHIVEDAAQAIGSKIGERYAGTMGAIGCFSFFPTKNLGGAGDGGMLTTNNKEHADKLRLLRVHGMEPRYYHKIIGINSRLDTLQAAVLRVKLRHLDHWSNARATNALIYNNFFEQAALDHVIRPIVHQGYRHIFHQYTIRVKHRDELKTHLQKAGVGAEIYYPVPLHLQECFSFLGYKFGDLPETDKASLECLSLPIYPELTSQQQSYVVDMISQFYK